MQALLTQPQVQTVVAEFLTLRADPAVVLDGPAGEAAVRAALETLFDTLRELMRDQQVLASAKEFSEDATQQAERILAGLDRGRLLCVGAALPEAVVALYLLRRRLRSLGPDARDERSVVGALDGVVALMAPGVSVLDLWQDNRSRCASLWTSLRGLMEAMDDHCPDPTAPPPPPPPTAAANAPPAPGPDPA